MHSFGESPSVAVESRLSQILAVNAPLRYYLSAKACHGIIRRAERRQKELPAMLREALYDQIKMWIIGV
jgi:cytidylate kinase